MTRVHISVGSNQDRERHLRGAVAALASDFGVLTVSPVYESPAVGFVGEPFLNLVIGFDTLLTPEILVERLHDIETREGRVRDGPKFGPRTLDLDLLLFDQRILHQGSLHIPRDEILNYAFVLKPLADIFPRGAHPETGRTYADHWDDFQARRPEDARALIKRALDFHT